MAIITPAKLNAYTDYAIRFLIASEGVAAGEVGLGRGIDAEDVWGASAEVENIKAELLSDTNLDSLNLLVSHVDQLTRLVTANTYVINMFAPFFGAIENHVTNYGLDGVRSLNDYLTFLNTGDTVKWQALQHPRWRDLRPYLAPSVWNCFQEIVQGDDYEDALGKWDDGVFTAGEVVDQTKYAGGFIQVNQDSNITNGMSDVTGTLTVTGTAMDPATKAFATGRTWTATITAGVIGAIAPGGATAAPTDSLIAAVSDIDISVAADGGLIYIEAIAPARGSLPS